MTSAEITVCCNISPSVPGHPVTLVKMSNGVSYLVYMYTLGAGRILIKTFYNYVLIESTGMKG